MKQLLSLSILLVGALSLLHCANATVPEEDNPSKQKGTNTSISIHDSTDKYDTLAIILEGIPGKDSSGWTTFRNGEHGEGTLYFVSKNNKQLQYAPAVVSEAQDEIVVHTFNGLDTITYTISISILSLNTPPTYSGTPTIEGALKVGNTLSIITRACTDLESDTLFSYTWHSVTDTTAPSAILLPSDSSALIIPQDAINGYIFAEATCSDSEGLSVTKTTTFVGPITKNNPPEITEGLSVSYNSEEDIDTTIYLHATDVNGDSIIWRWNRSTSENGTATLEGYGDSATITFMPTKNYNGEATVQFTAGDGIIEDTITLNFTIAAIADAPIINTNPSIIGHAHLDSTLSIDTTEVCFDPDEDEIALHAYAWYSDTDLLDTNGTLIVNATDIHYTIQPTDMGKYIYAEITCSDQETPSLATLRTTPYSTNEIRVNRSVGDTASNGFQLIAKSALGISSEHTISEVTDGALGIFGTSDEGVIISDRSNLLHSQTGDLVPIEVTVSNGDKLTIDATIISVIKVLTVNNFKEGSSYYSNTEFLDWNNHNVTYFHAEAVNDPQIVMPTETADDIKKVVLHMKQSMGAATDIDIHLHDSDSGWSTTNLGANSRTLDTEFTVIEIPLEEFTGVTAATIDSLKITGTASPLLEFEMKSIELRNF
ncbi:MAG: Ig-like domain-containing protein [Reichenbachiella sp.]